MTVGRDIQLNMPAGYGTKSNMMINTLVEYWSCFECSI